MCRAHHWTEQLAQAELAAELAGVDLVRKADPPSPLTPAGFDVAVIAATAAVVKEVAAPERATMKRIERKLKRNWTTMSVAARNRAIAQAMAELGPLAVVLTPKVGVAIEKSFADMMVATNKAAAAGTPQVAIIPSTLLVDDKVVRHARTSQRFFIRNEYGARQTAYSAQARGIVAGGIRNGLDSIQISKQLERALSSTNLNRSRAYYRNTASIYQARARSYGLLRSFDEAGIVHYVFDAVLDARTTEQCRFLHGKRFAVKKAIQKHKSVAETDPESVYGIQPFMDVGRDAAGQFLYYRDGHGGPRKQVARVTTPAVGKVDKVGSYSRAMSPGAIESAGLSVPPLHGLCRSTLQPEF